MRVAASGCRHRHRGTETQARDGRGSDSPNAAALPGGGVPQLERADAATLRAVFELTPTILSITDLETGRMLDVNDAFVRVSGFSRDSIGPALSATSASGWAHGHARAGSCHPPQDGGSRCEEWRRAFA